MAESNEDLVRKGYGAFSSGDMGTLAEVLSPDVVQHVAGNNLVSGDHKGRDAVFAMYGQLMELTAGTLRVQPDSVRADGDDRVVAHHTGTGDRNGKHLAVGQTLIFTIRDGQAVDIEQTSDDQAAEDKFWS
jgi:ketosteroid isomerase-like protein